MAFAACFATIVFVAMVALAKVPEPKCAREYIVNLGDTCNTISARQNVSTYQLAHVNAKIINAACDNLVFGELLCLGIFGQDCNVTTVVESGDVCPAIARKAGIETALLLDNNPNVNAICGNIYPGEVLCTAKTLFVLS